MPHWLSHKLLRFLGVITVTAIVGFLLLPALVVTLAAFNGRAILSFPPETWSWRWFIKAIEYQDFQLGFRNGLIVTAWASSIALVVGAAFALALERYEFRFKRALETVLLSPLVVPHRHWSLRWLPSTAGRFCPSRPKLGHGVGSSRRSSIRTFSSASATG